MDNRGIKHYVVFNNDTVTITRHMNHGVILSVTKTFEDTVTYSKAMKSINNIIALDDELYRLLSDL